MWAHLQSLNMLVVAEGKERTLPEYTALLKRAGFSKIEARRRRALLTRFSRGGDETGKSVGLESDEGHKVHEEIFVSLRPSSW